MKNLFYLFIIANIFNTYKAPFIKISEPQNRLIVDEYPLNYPNLEVAFYDESGLIEICFAMLNLCTEAQHILKTPEGEYFSQPQTTWKHGNECLYFKMNGVVDLVTETGESRVVVQRWEKHF